MLDFINEHIITLRGHTNPHICKNYIEWFKTHHFELELNQILKLTDFLSSDVKFKERIYCLRNSITQVMLCSKKDCVREVSFHNSVYQKFCSLTCRSNSEDTKIKTKSTVLKKYGVDNVSKATSIKGKISTSLKNNINFKDIIKVNIFKRYSEEFYNRAFDSNLDVTVYDHNNVGDSRELKCKKCRKTFRYGDYKTLFQSGLRCPFCFPKRFSKIEKSISDFIKGMGYEVLCNDRKIFGCEIDILIPECKTGIEIDGILWHSFGPSKYSYMNKPKADPQHLNTKTKCLSDRDFTLLRFTDVEVHEKREIVESIIRCKLGGVKEKIYARKCEVRNVDHSTTMDFLLENHLIGKVAGASHRIGLYYNGELVMIMTFCKPRFSKDHDWELLRLCTLKNTVVVGGFSKLLSHGRKSGINGTIQSFVDRRFSNGSGYLSVGFKYIRTTSPNYFYWHKDTGRIVKRYGAQKHKLSKLLGELFKKELTETENMYNAGYRKFYDCGNDVYEIT